MLSVAQTMLSQDICPSVRPSHASILWRRMQGYKNHDYRPIFCFISEMTQDRASCYGM